MNALFQLPGSSAAHPARTAATDASAVCQRFGSQLGLAQIEGSEKMGSPGVYGADESPGAFLFKESVFSMEEIAEAALLADRISGQRVDVHAAGRYAGVQWFESALDPDVSFCRKVLDELGSEGAEVLGFYYLEPGARIHPHRDLTGASLNNRIRFHVPIVTNPGVDFRVSGRKIVMKPGDLWYLDTSYRHSVANTGQKARVHLIIECAITDKIRPAIPRTFRARVHNVKFVSLLGFKFLEALFKNSLTDPAYFKAQMGMIKRFVGWRLLKRHGVHDQR